jgi:histone deacetylase 1/2
MHISKEDAEIMIMMDAKYKQFLREDGSMVVKLSKALYGCIESAKLWYAEISKTFRSIGYTCNPKDICVFNKIVDGVQCTITLHVDDLMVTSVIESLIDEVMNALRKHYERDGAELDVKVGKIHNYLGMTFDFSIDGQVLITMNKYVSEVLKFTEIKGTVNTPATTDLYTIIDSEKLEPAKSEYFHSVVAKLLYLSKRVRPDLLTSVGYLAKRVNDSTKMDMVKLERVLRYLNSTSELGLTLRPSDHLSIFSHIDASYAVHHDMKSQTGVTITLGEGVTYAKSTTQQLNSKSSTEAELIALTDASGHVIWVRDYLIGQGYPIGPATIYQDNMSTMALVKKGYSTSSNTRHINIRYFFIKDRVDSEELKIEYLPTEDMIADFFTKPLQGDAFKKLRDKILGINSIDRAFIACL